MCQVATDVDGRARRCQSQNPTAVGSLRRPDPPSRRGRDRIDAVAVLDEAPPADPNGLPGCGPPGTCGTGGPGSTEASVVSHTPDLHSSADNKPAAATVGN